MTSKVFYVYLLIDPNTNQPFYVGKGRDDRMLYHERAATRNYADATKPHHERIKQILASGRNVVYRKVLVNATEKQAYSKERQLGKHYGRICNGTGILLNISTCGSRGGKTEKPVSQYTLEGVHVADFESAKVASEQVHGANRSYITQVAKGRRRSAGGYLWTYKGELVPKFNKEYYSPVIQFNVETKKRINVFRSMTEAQKVTGIELHNISEACRGNSRSAGGYLWEYA